MYKKELEGQLADVVGRPDRWQANEARWSGERWRGNEEGVENETRRE